MQQHNIIIVIVDKIIGAKHMDADLLESVEHEGSHVWREQPSVTAAKPLSLIQTGCVLL